MQNNVLEVKNLTKNFRSSAGEFTAVDNISFSIKQGDAVGFLGPNGAGKTTTIQMLLGITNVTSGSIQYFGKDFFKHKQQCLQRINFTSAFNTLHGRISVWENLIVFATLYNVKNPKEKIMNLINYFNSESLLNQRYWNLSAGQKTRINFIKSLLNDPELILMDEPTASIDPDVVDKTLSLIEELKDKRNLTILYTSHNMNEITRICNKVIFLDHGQIVAQDSPLSLTKRIGSAKLQITFDGDKEKLENYLKEKRTTYSFIKKYIVVINTQEKDIPGIIFGISKSGIWIADIEVKKPTLEDFFLQIARGGISVNSKN